MRPVASRCLGLRVADGRLVPSRPGALAFGFAPGLASAGRATQGRAVAAQP
jgi:hypothetical protein